MTVADDPDLLPPPRRSFYQRHEALILGGSAVAIALGIWEALWEAGKISPLFFTGPSQVVQRFIAEWNECAHPFDWTTNLSTYGELY